MYWLTLLLIIFCLLLVFGIGGQDESMATVYGSGSLKLRTAIIVGSFFAFLGVLFLSGSVGETIGENLLGETVNVTSYMILAILLGTATWLILASKTHVPISTTHSIVGAVVGISIVWAIINRESFLLSLNWTTLGLIFLGWVVSPLLGYLGAMVGQYFINKILAKRSSGLLNVEKTEKVFRVIIIIFACINQVSRGGNDSGNAIGIFYGLINSGDIDAKYFWILVLLSGLVFVLGLVFIGKNLVRNVGKTTGNLRPSEAVAIEGTTATIILLATIIGFPVSGGHILIFAMIGSARLKGEKPDPKSFRRMIISWIITFPIAAALSALFFTLFIVAL
jgi:inorganic phosphate transporter, PiT family